jgi:hypothetical protein
LGHVVLGHFGFRVVSSRVGSGIRSFSIRFFQILNRIKSERIGQISRIKSDYAVMPPLLQTKVHRLFRDVFWSGKLSYVRRQASPCGPIETRLLQMIDNIKTVQTPHQLITVQKTRLKHSSSSSFRWSLTLIGRIFRSLPALSVIPPLIRLTSHPLPSSSIPRSIALAPFGLCFDLIVFRYEYFYRQRTEASSDGLPSPSNCICRCRNFRAAWIRLPLPSSTFPRHAVLLWKPKSNLPRLCKP